MQSCRALTNLQVHVLSPLEVLHDTQPVRLLIIPHALEPRPLLQRPQRILPVPVRIVGQPLEHVPTGEPQKRRVHIRQCLREVHPQSILPVLVRRREQADEVEVQVPLLGAGSVKGDGKRVVRVGRVLGRHELKRMLDPLVGHGLAVHLDGAKHLVREIRLQRCREAPLVRALDPERARVLLPTDGDAPVPFVLEANLARAVPLALGHAHRRGQRLGQRRRQVLDAQSRATDREVVRRRDGEGFGVLERAVLDQFGVNAAVA